ncbi:hypothetical protein AC623_20690 [Bacillus sp. FJAT-27231]|uniref:hypothetical protein n=1 Tax=Bacillus sp. FJAT-27231 TaxID=1679168 RepID=UPI000671471C|nr:hypothetical protein [Bacillus sp. FJAT-27231]KMY52556.1 hypothetical protein AC623_20690 [Bacillus sp. FJAT-27231]
MIYVVFSNSTVSEIKPDRKIPFADACELTHKLEKINRENGIVSDMDFYLVDDNYPVNDERREPYNHATLSIGSGFADNIYDHIHKKLHSLELDEEQKRERNRLLTVLAQEIKGLHLEEYENEETYEEEYEPVQTKWQLFKIVGMVLGVVAVVVTIFLVVLGFNSTPTETASNTNETLLQALRYASIQQYDSATEEFEKLKYDDLEKQDRKAMLFSYLLSGQAQKAIDLEPSFTESVISYYVAMDNLEKLSELEIDEPALQFEKAYQQKQYVTVTDLSDEVSLDGRREEMVVNSFIEMGQLEQALKFAESIGNTTLKEKVSNLIKQKKAKEKEPKKGQENNTNIESKTA